ncbi:hypothetical protein V1520DRAFT_364998 [Lipomyces starkeyi]
MPELKEALLKTTFSTKVLSVSDSAERNWSTFGYIHSNSHNRLKNSGVDKLVFLYANAPVEGLGQNEFNFQEACFETKPGWFNEEEEPEIMSVNR